jgi:hypothetical protein
MIIFIAEYLTTAVAIQNKNVINAIVKITMWHFLLIPVFSGSVLLNIQFSVWCFVDHCLSFCPFPLASVLSVVLRFAASVYIFDIFEFFLFKLIHVHWLCFSTLSMKSVAITPYVVSSNSAQERCTRYNIMQ